MFAYQDLQAQPQSETYQTVRASQCDMSNQSMIGLFPQTYLNAPNGTIPPASHTISAVNAPQFFYTIYSPQPRPAGDVQNGGYAAYAPRPPYTTQGNFSGYMPAHSMTPYTQARQGHTAERQGAMHKDVRGIDSHRGLYSTNHLTLQTPFNGSLGHAYRVPVDRSPIYPALSPQTPHNVLPPAEKPFPYKAISVNRNIATLSQTIPKAVPAVFTPENTRTLDQSLSNQINGNRNVYIRGLHPDTNDEILAAYARPFGSVETLKAIIDTATGACKGFGFVKYFDVRDSEKCIRGFYDQGYEVGFARKSFSSRLKAKGDHSSTNLYVSNLPKSMNEMELVDIFMNYNVVSSKILHDSQGNSCGAGFARFDSRDICESIIRSYHGKPIGKEGHLLQVRYADTPAQKDLKNITSVRRRFRIDEYNVSAYGSPVDVANISLPMPSAGVSRIAQRTSHLSQLKDARSWKRNGPSSNKTKLTDETPARGSAFKDLDARITQTMAIPCKQQDPEQQDESSTRPVSDDDSAEEGATINCLSPARV